MTESVSIPYLPILVAALLTMPVGFLWFSPMLFARRWTALNPQLNPEMKPTVLPFVLTLLFQIAMAFVLWLLIEILGIRDVFTVWIVAGTLWLVFDFLPATTHHLFDKRPMQLLLINNVYDLANILVMSTVLVLWS